MNKEFSLELSSEVVARFTYSLLLPSHGSKSEVVHSVSSA